MKKLLLTLAFVLFASYADAGKFWVQPECPYTGHATCSDNKDNDVDGTKDEAAPAAAFGAVTGGYAADVAECQLLTYAATTDAESISGDSAQKSGTYRQGQIGCAGNFTNATYFVWVRGRVESGTSEDKRVGWMDTSPFIRSFQNSKSFLPFTATNGISSAMAWSIVGEGLNFNSISTANSQNPHTTAHKSIALNGNAVIYLTADEAVDFDCIFLSTNAAAVPLCPDESDTAPQAGTITVSSVTSSGFTTSWDYDTESADDGDCFLNYGTEAGNLTSQSSTVASSSGTCSTPITGLAEGTIYFMRGTSDGGVDGSSQTPETSVQTSVQTTGPIRFAVASGGSGSSTCLTGQPTCTLARALNQGQPGDTIQLANGTYTLPSGGFGTVRAGTASQPITITAENRHMAIISAGISTSRLFRVQHSHNHIKKIVFDGNNICCTDGIQVFPGAPPTAAITGIVLEDNRIIETQGNSIVWTGNVNGYLYRWNFLNRTTNAGSGEAFYTGSASGSGSAQNGELYANEIIDPSMECIDVKTGATNIFFHHNICDGSGRLTSTGISTAKTSNYGPITVQSTGANLRFENNIIRNFKVRDNGGGAVMAFSGSASSVLVKNNVFRDQLFGNKKLANTSGAGTAEGNTFCSFLSTTIDGGWTLVSNDGAPGADAADSACDDEETRILAEMELLPGNPSP